MAVQKLQMKWSVLVTFSNYTKILKQCRKTIINERLFMEKLYIKRNIESTKENWKLYIYLNNISLRYIFKYQLLLAASPGKQYRMCYFRLSITFYVRT